MDRSRKQMATHRFPPSALRKFPLQPDNNIPSPICIQSALSLSLSLSNSVLTREAYIAGKESKKGTKRRQEKKKKKKHLQFQSSLPPASAAFANENRVKSE
jgi:hypothetical protein